MGSKVWSSVRPLTFLVTISMLIRPKHKHYRKNTAVFLFKEIYNRDESITAWLTVQN